jgi:hypothetical protein
MANRPTYFGSLEVNLHPRLVVVPEGSINWKIILQVCRRFLLDLDLMHGQEVA